MKNEIFERDNYSFERILKMNRLVVCKQCAEKKSSDSFSKRQLTCSNLRKCKECVEKNKPPPQSERNREIEEMRENIVFSYSPPLYEN